MNHTPGPWKLELDYDGERHDWAIRAPGVGMPLFVQTTYYPMVSDNLADAYLISAAPELLEALKECADRLQIHMKHTEDLIAHMKAHKAIAKAEGK